MNEEMYYIQDSRTYHGNAVVWWCENGRGYTSNFKEAGKFTQEAAAKICERKTDVAWPCEYIDQNLKCQLLIIDMQYLRKIHSGIKIIQP